MHAGRGGILDIKVKFRFNKLTGEVEEFLVDQDSALPRAEHERAHDRIAAELGRVVERLPRVTEILEGGGATLGSEVRTEPPESGEEEEKLPDHDEAAARKEG